MPKAAKEADADADAKDGARVSAAPKTAIILQQAGSNRPVCSLKLEHGVRVRDRAAMDG